jgi:hypothetical protein
MIISSARFLIRTGIPLFAGMLALVISLESAADQQNSILTTTVTPAEAAISSCQR